MVAAPTDVDVWGAVQRQSKGTAENRNKCSRSETGDTGEWKENERPTLLCLEQVFAEAQTRVNNGVFWQIVCCCLIRRDAGYFWMTNHLKFSLNLLMFYPLTFGQIRVSSACGCNAKYYHMLPFFFFKDTDVKRGKQCINNLWAAEKRRVTNIFSWEMGNKNWCGSGSRRWILAKEVWEAATPPSPGKTRSVLEVGPLDGSHAS